MPRYKKFLIKADDHFDEFDYPHLEDEMKSIITAIAEMPADFKSEMIISYAKNKSIEPEWEKRNPSLAQMLKSKSLAIENLGDLFDSCTHNNVFCLELEGYARKMLS